MSEQQDNNTLFLKEEVEKLTWNLFSIKTNASNLDAYDGQNFLLNEIDKTENSAKYILKISGADEGKERLEGQNACLSFLQNKHLPFKTPCLIKSVDDQEMVPIKDKAHREVFVRMLCFVPGTFACDIVENSSSSLFHYGSWGESLGLLTKALGQFVHPACTHYFNWDHQNISEHRKRLMFCGDDSLKKIIEKIFDDFEDDQPYIGKLRRSVVHYDANDRNVLFSQIDGRYVFSGLIDFGDLFKTQTIAEIAIASAYAILEKNDPISILCQMVGGFHKAFALMEKEINYLLLFIKVRLSISVLMSFEQISQRPYNKYLLISQKPSINMLHALGHNSRKENEKIQDQLNRIVKG